MAMEMEEDYGRYLADSLTDHIAVIDAEGVIRYVNHSWQKFSDDNSEGKHTDYIGANYLAVCETSVRRGDPDATSAVDGIRSVIDESSGLFLYEYPCHSVEEKRWFAMRVTRMDWSGPARFIVSHLNITERKLAEDELRGQSFLDGLTGLSNRRHFDFFLDKEWRRAQRNKREISLILMDIDSFKAFNDNYGHVEGDKCLERVTGALKNFANRPGDLAARYGGEEFAVILSDTPSDSAAAIAEKFRIAVAQLHIPHGYSETEKFVTISLGVATLEPENTMSEKVLIERADRALYTSKRSGRNRVSVL